MDDFQDLVKQLKQDIHEAKEQLEQDKAILSANEFRQDIPTIVAAAKAVGRQEERLHNYKAALKKLERENKYS